MNKEKIHQPKIALRGELTPPSPIRKLAPLADEAKRKGIRVYHLNIGQPEIKTPEEIMEALRNYKEEVLAYGPSMGIAELRQELVRYYAHFDISLTLDDIMITTGGSEAILFALMAVCDPQDEVITFEPFYTNYAGFATMAGVNLIALPTLLENGFHLPLKSEITRKITPRTKAILYCSPNNPTGTIYTREELLMLSQIVKEYNLFLLADEVYREFVYDGVIHTGILTLKEIEERAILLDSISKRFSACGARIGCLISKNHQVMETVLKFGQARLCPPTIEQIGAVAGYRVWDAYLKKIVVEFNRRRDVMCEELVKIPSCVFYKPEGAFYLIVRLPIDDSENFARWLLSDFSLDKKTVMLAPADGFYLTEGSGRQEVRIAYVLKEQALRDAIRILAKGIEAYNRRR